MRRSTIVATLAIIASLTSAAIAQAASPQSWPTPGTCVGGNSTPLRCTVIRPTKTLAVFGQMLARNVQSSGDLVAQGAWYLTDKTRPGAVTVTIQCGRSGYAVSSVTNQTGSYSLTATLKQFVSGLNTARTCHIEVDGTAPPARVGEKTGFTANLKTT